MPKTYQDGELLINDEFYQIPSAYSQMKIDYDFISPVIAEYLKENGVILLKHLKGNNEAL